MCNLASLSLPMFVKDKDTFDFQKLFEMTKIVTRNLNKIIDINHYPVPEAKKSNFRHRPIGVGVQGLADVFILMRMPFDSPASKELNKLIFETIYFACLTGNRPLHFFRFSVSQNKLTFSCLSFFLFRFFSS